MIEGFDHVGTDHKCSVCQCTFTDDEGGIQGYLGSLPVAFCPPCFSGLCDMVEQLNDREWVGLTDEEVHALWMTGEANISEEAHSVAAYEVEAKLKQKNGYAEEKNT